MGRSHGKGQLLTDKIFELLKREIVTGGLKPGEAFREVTMAKRFKASRTPVREACNRFSNTGLLVSVANKGYTVAPITIKDILNVYDLRLLVEPVCAEYAARNLSDKEAAELEALLQPEREKLEDVPHMTLIDLNMVFHHHVAQATKNDRIVSLIDSLLLAAARMDYAFIELYPTEHTGHAEILARLKARDAMGARKVMCRHIQLSRQRMSMMFSSERLALSPASLEGGSAF
jgi:DNA-binding GntR family transcriptional regulator